jgi:hypothetical protein
MDSKRPIIIEHSRIKVAVSKYTPTVRVVERTTAAWEQNLS